MNPYDAFLAYVEREKAQTTYEGYSRTLRAFQQTHPSPYGLTSDLIAAWLARPTKDGRARAVNTRRSEVGTLKAFWRWLHSEYAATNIMADVRMPPKPRRVRPRAISRAQVNDLLDVISTDHQRAMLLLMSDAGLRVSEACALSPDRVVLQGKRRYLRVLGKGDAERLIPIGGRLVTALGVQLNRYKREGWSPGEPLIRTKSGRPYNRNIVWEFVALAGLRAGIEDMHPHRLRHSWAHWLHYERHLPLGVVSRLLGHAALSTTQTYLGVRDEELFTMLDFLNDESEPTNPFRSGVE